MEVLVTYADIESLRRLVGDIALDDQALAETIALSVDEDTSINLDRAAARVWREKAAEFSSLVDISESGSSRKMSDLYKSALAMASMYDGRVTASEPEGPALQAVRPTTRPIVRRGAR